MTLLINSNKQKRRIDMIASRLSGLAGKSKSEVQAIVHAQLVHLQCLGFIDKWMFRMENDRVIIRFVLDFSDLQGIVMEVPWHD